jgi:hypothetical protein
VLILAIYTFILSLGVLAGLARRRMLLLCGRGVFVLTGLSGMLDLALVAIRQQATPIWPIALWLTLVAAALAARPQWFFLWFDPKGFEDEVEASLRMLLIAFVKTGAGYTLQLRNGDVYLQLHAGPGRTAVLKFRQSREHKKADLLRSLLRKKFDPLFPRLKIRIR